MANTFCNSKGHFQKVEGSVKKNYWFKGGDSWLYIGRDLPGGTVKDITTVQDPVRCKKV